MKMKYMFETKARGIRYRSDGHDQRTTKYDAAFDPDEKDGKSRVPHIFSHTYPSDMTCSPPPGKVRHRTFGELRSTMFRVSPRI